ncbi:hypothetical protein M2H09_20900, partial [Vibrio vulnificus]|nr:hypothetical protein [Vibrio vulnificus]
MINWDSVEWRVLNEGEVIKEGDYVDVTNDGWRDNPEWKLATCIGEQAPDPSYPSHRTYRRIVDPKKNLTKAPQKDKILN